MSMRMVLIIRIKYLGKEERVYGHNDAWNRKCICDRVL